MPNELKNYEKYLKQLPVLPEVATKILSATADGIDVSFKDLQNIIKVDPGLTAKILKVANSALYARQREITSLQMAITLLGFKNIKSLVLLVTASNMISGLKKTKFYQTFWKHSINTAFLAKHIALRCDERELADEAFLGGLLHDIGQTAFFNSDQKGYQTIIDQLAMVNSELEELEKNYFGFDHKELGASILKNWFFPDIYVDIAREHFSLNITSKYKTIIVMVTIADLLTEILGFSFENVNREDTLLKFLAYTTLTESDVEYYRDKYLEDLSQDTLFQECRSLFALRA